MLLELESHRGGKPTGRIRQKNEQRIISAAEIEFANHGYKGATMNNIALLAKLPKSNIHYYFKNKLNLYAEVLASILDLWDSALNQLDSEEDPSVALQEYIVTKMRFARENPLSSRIFAKEILSGAPRLEEIFSDDYHRWFKSKTRVFKTWAKQGKIDSIEPAHIIFLIWSATQHYSDFSVQIAAAMGKKSLSKADYDAAAKSLVTIITRGVAAH